MKKFLIENNFVLYGRCLCGGVYTEKWRNLARTIFVHFTKNKGRIVGTPDVLPLDKLQEKISKLIAENETIKHFQA